MKRWSSLLALILLLICTGCELASRPDDSNHVRPSPLARWQDAEDNANLAQGYRLAVFISGLSRRGVIENVLRALAINVIHAVGSHNVDVFVHTEVAHGSNLTAASLSQLVHELLPPHSVRAVIIDAGGPKSTQLMTGVASGGWKHKPHHLLQFTALQELYGMLLKHERTVDERYGYVARVRSDALLLSPWPILPGSEGKEWAGEGQSAYVSDSSGSAWNRLVRDSVGGPSFHLKGHKSDKFYIAPRSSSWRVFMDLPLFFNLHISPKDAWREIGCDQRGPLDDYVLASCDRWGCPRGGGARGCEFCCGDATSGAFSPLICPEVWLPVAFQRLGLLLVDSCAITQQYALLGRHHPFERHCSPAPPHDTTLWSADAHLAKEGQGGEVEVGPTRLAPPHPQHVASAVPPPRLSLVGPMRCDSNGSALLEIALSNLAPPAAYMLEGEVTALERQVLVATSLTARSGHISMFLGLSCGAAFSQTAVASYRISLYDATLALVGGSDGDDGLLARASGQRAVPRCPIATSEACTSAGADPGDGAWDSAKCGGGETRDRDMYELVRVGGELHGLELYASLLRLYSTDARERMGEVLEQEVARYGQMRSIYYVE